MGYVNWKSGLPANAQSCFNPLHKAPEAPPPLLHPSWESEFALLQ